MGRPTPQAEGRRAFCGAPLQRLVSVFAAFQFDPEASKDIDETNWPGVTLLKAQMNTDLLTEDLKKKLASNESFWLIGQSDVSLEEIRKGEDAGKYRVTVNGFDYYNTRTGEIESGSAGKIAIWMIDPDYDGRTLFPRQVFFPMAGRGTEAEIDEGLIEAYRGTVSLAFSAGDHRRAAVARHTVHLEKAVRAAHLAGLASDYETFRSNVEKLHQECEMLTGRKVAWDEWKKSVKETIRFYLSQKIRLTLPDSCVDNVAIFYAQANQNLSRLLSED